MARFDNKVGLVSGGARGQGAAEARLLVAQGAKAVIGVTAYLNAGGTLENAQAMAAHESPRTTKLYDRTGDEITLDEVERITI
jgi:NAD(P)-dependent dehydrogenase (short-subunit alcohol dehydrogenase family)